MLKTVIRAGFTLALWLLPLAAQVPVDLQVPLAPTPFSGAGKTHLAWELHITNFGGQGLNLHRLEVLAGDSPLASFEGAELTALFSGARDVLVKDSLSPGLRAVAFLWLTLDAGKPVPATLHHRLTTGTDSVDGAPITVSTASPVVLDPPLRGANWISANGPSNTSVHRRALIPVGGKARIAQRFAIDWFQIGPDGKSFTGDPADNRSYRAYGQEVLAVADGVVAELKDAIPENVPGPSERAVPITLDTIGGNHIILDLGGGHFATYLHLQPGSLRVKSGERVHRGQALALVGNSGNSSEAHLHFQVTDQGSVLGAEGLPFALEAFETEVGEPRRNAMPMRNEKISLSEH